MQRKNKLRSKRCSSQIRNMWVLCDEWNHVIASCLNHCKTLYYLNWQHLEAICPTLCCLSLCYSKPPCMTVGLPRLVTLTSKFRTVFICCISLLSSIAQVHKLGLLISYGCDRQNRLEPYQLLVVFRALWWIDLRWINLWWTVCTMNRPCWNDLVMNWPMMKRPGIVITRWYWRLLYTMCFGTHLLLWELPCLVWIDGLF